MDVNERVCAALQDPRARTRSSGVVYTFCPFHSEKTPSFVFHPATRRWLCYGCQMQGALAEDEDAPPPVLAGQLALFP